MKKQSKSPEKKEEPKPKGQVSAVVELLKCVVRGDTQRGIAGRPVHKKPEAY